MEKLLEAYFDRLFPLNRSITGNGVRQTFDILNELVDFKITEVPSGTQIFDWTVPKEWNVTEAYIITPQGEKIADFSENNLHLVGYSIPFTGEMSLEELRPHLFTLKEQPDAIPYVTSYYREKWGFCLSQKQLDILPSEGLYQVVINSTLENGSMTTGEAVLEGESDKEIFFTKHFVHDWSEIVTIQISHWTKICDFNHFVNLPNRKALGLKMLLFFCGILLR